MENTSVTLIKDASFGLSGLGSSPVEGACMQQSAMMWVSYLPWYLFRIALYFGGIILFAVRLNHKVFLERN